MATKLAAAFVVGVIGRERPVDETQETAVAITRRTEFAHLKALEGDA